MTKRATLTASLWVMTQTRMWLRLLRLRWAQSTPSVYGQVSNAMKTTIN